MKKIFAVGLLMCVSLSAFAKADHSTTIHFSAQELGMQIRHYKNMSVRTMCFIVGSTGHARNQLSYALFASEKTEAVREMIELSAKVESNVSKLTSLCVDDGVSLSTALQTVYTHLGQKPSVAEIPQLLKEISISSEAIVKINLAESQEKAKARSNAKTSDSDVDMTSCEVNGHGNICIGK